MVNDGKQVDEYRSAAARSNTVPGEFHVCGELPSIAAVRNFMLREVWDAKTEPFFVQMDDDFRAMRPMMVWRSRRVSNPEDVAAIFWESYISSNDAGAKVFGYGHKPSFQHRGPPTRRLPFGAGFGLSLVSAILPSSTMKSSILWKTWT